MEMILKKCRPILPPKPRYEVLWGTFQIRKVDLAQKQRKSLGRNSLGLIRIIYITLCLLKGEEVCIKRWMSQIGRERFFFLFFFFNSPTKENELISAEVGF